MFLKLTDNETETDIYLNPVHITRFVPNPAGVGTIVYMANDTSGSSDEPMIIMVHETAEEVFRMISRSEKPQKAGANRGLI